MPKWEWIPGNSVLPEYVWWDNAFVLRLGKHINGISIRGRDGLYLSRSEAEKGILAQAHLLRQIADEIEAALAKAPKGVPDA